MRQSSSRAATAAALVAGLAVLALAGRLLPTTPSLSRPATPTSAGVPAGTVRMIPLRDVPTSTVVGGVRVANAIGHTLARATSLMRAGGLRGAAFERDPQIGAAVVVAQEPPAGLLVPPAVGWGFGPGPTCRPMAAHTGRGWSPARPTPYTSWLPPIRHASSSPWS